MLLAIVVIIFDCLKRFFGLPVQERREGEIAALVRDEVRILTNQMRTELDLIKSNFFSEIRELLYQLRESLKVLLLGG